MSCVGWRWAKGAQECTKAMPAPDNKCARATPARLLLGVQVSVCQWRGSEPSGAPTHAPARRWRACHPASDNRCRRGDQVLRAYRPGRARCRKPITQLVAHTRARATRSRA